MLKTLKVLNTRTIKAIIVGCGAITAGLLAPLTAMDFHEITLKNAVPLEVKRAMDLFPQSPVSHLDVVIRLRVKDNQLQPYGWAHLPTLAGNQYLVRVDEKSSYPNDLKLSFEMHLKKEIGGTNKPVDLSGRVDVTINGLTTFALQSQREQDMKLIEQYSLGFNFVQNQPIAAVGWNC